MGRRHADPPPDGAAMLFTKLIKLERIGNSVYVMEGESDNYVAKCWMTEEFVVALQDAIAKARPGNVVQLQSKKS